MIENIELRPFLGSVQQFGLHWVPSYVYTDERGMFKKTPCDLIKVSPVFFDLKEVYITTSKRGSVRGMHVQGPTHSIAKIVSVVRGQILDIIVDVRSESINFGQYMKFYLSESSDSILVPRGFAHGFQALEDDSMVLYQTDGYYCSDCDSGFNVSAFGHEWEISKGTMSQRDKGLKDFECYSYSESNHQSP